MFVLRRKNQFLKSKTTTNSNAMKCLKSLFILFLVLNSVNSVHSQINNSAINNALLIVEKIKVI